MAKTYTEEQLNTFDKATLIQLLLMQQSQLQEIDKKLQLLLEQAAVLKNNRFGKKSEKLGIENQVCFMEVDGDIVFFNEAEAVNALVPEDEEKSTKPKNAKTKGKRTADIKDLPVIHVDHKMTESELITEFGEDGWYQLEDEIYRRYRFTPMKIEIEEHHVGVYKSKKDNHFKKAEHPAYLLRNSLVSPTLLSGIWNAKYVNAVPLYRQEQEFKEWESPLTVVKWRIGRFCVRNDICLFFMITYMRRCMTIMCFRQMRLRCSSQKKIEHREAGITCGYIVPVRCIRTNQSYCMNINPLEMQIIQEYS